MLILHQTGSVRVGEVVRYTLTYTPSADRILPAPSNLHVKIKNTSAIPLRAAYLHGPYTLYVACYPSTFDPNAKHERHKEEGAPEFEPNLKAGGHWSSKLTVPEEIREAAGGPQSRRSLEGHSRSFTWIIEIASQVIFSTTAAVHFELLVGRDEKSVDLGFHGVVGSGQGAPGRLEDHQQGHTRNAGQQKGVFSKAVTLVVDDTESLWNSPPFPTWDYTDGGNATAQEAPKRKKQQKVHLVLLTHGLHSNLGADMLYLKESIGNAARQAREDSKKRKAELRNSKIEHENRVGRDAAARRTKSTPEAAVAPTQNSIKDEDDDDEDDEQVLVRGFSGNAVRTERGIQYLGKRLAKFVLSLTYPDQPYLPVKSSISKSITRTLIGQKINELEARPTHKNSSILKDEHHANYNLPYKITSISFIAHSLGGLVQTYAIAYIQKHSPDFFELIKPINFVAMATPFLGLSNENPLYVKFALDFGLVGRTGQDLGLTWRAPTLARSGWGAMIAGLGNDNQKGERQLDPGSKPLLRILPTGPAHTALKKFRNRSVYSNVVNDGIVPLRTSCLLFLDWRGLGRVEKARREMGLVGTIAGWGWAEMMGQNASSLKRQGFGNDLSGDSGDEVSGPGSKASRDHGDMVPQAEAGEDLDDNAIQSPDKSRFLEQHVYQDETHDFKKAKETSPQQPPSAWAGLVSLFKPQASKKPQSPPKQQKIYRRGQTMKANKETRRNEDNNDDAAGKTGQEGRRGPVRGFSLYNDSPEEGNVEAPPRTTFFEAAGDVLNPPLPPKDFLIDPSCRPRTIFHDRVYHPGDIPAPPVKRPRTFSRRSSREATTSHHANTGLSKSPNRSGENVEVGGMKIEEKIARAYHKELSWRKVLVRLEPDAHNNMIVRRMFANAYGWPVVKHLCDTHFGYTLAAQIPDEEESAKERAKPAEAEIGEEGEQVKGQVEPPPDEAVDAEAADHQRRKSVDDAATSSSAEIEDLHHDLQKLNAKLRLSTERTDSEVLEATDEVKNLLSHTTTRTGDSRYSTLNSTQSRSSRQDSARWSDRFFEGSDDDDDDDSLDQEYQKMLQKLNAGRDRDGESRLQQPPLPQGPHKNGILSKHRPTLTASPEQSTLDLVTLGRTTGTPGESSNTGRTLETHPDDGVPDPLALGLTGIGLRKSLDEQLSPFQDRRGNVGVAEQVALARSQPKEEKNMPTD